MTMLKDERKDSIKQYVYQEGLATVAELSDLLRVSPATIRRDIDELASRNLVKRIHGGITLPNSARREPRILQRRHFQAEEKQKIGKAAAQLIQDDETVFLGSGSTVLEVAENLEGRRNLTVITNSLLVEDLLVKESGINLVMTGGFLNKPESSLIGHLVKTSLSELRADKVVMSIQAIHLQQGLTNNDLIETMTDRAICNFSPHRILVADHTKFNKASASFVAEISVITTLITDSKTPTDFLKELENMGIKVIIAPE